MNSVTRHLSPTATQQIRADHAHVLGTFHRYTADTSNATKQAIVNTACLALEVHAQLEEEIFYPALRAIEADGDVLAKSVPEHDRMRQLIGELRQLRAGDPAFDNTFLELMRDVLHHVADEETVLLPAAERQLADQLDELGERMTRRRMQLTLPRAGEIAVNSARAWPAGTLVAAGGALVVGTWALRRVLERRAVN